MLLPLLARLPPLPLALTSPPHHIHLHQLLPTSLEYALPIAEYRLLEATVQPPLRLPLQPLPLPPAPPSPTSPPPRPLPLHYHHHHTITIVQGSLYHYRLE